MTVVPAACYAHLTPPCQGQVVGIADTGLDWNSCFFKDDKVTPKFRWNEEKRIKNRKKNKYDSWTSTKHRKVVVVPGGPMILIGQEEKS